MYSFISILVSLGFNPRSGGSNLVSCSTESGGVSHKTSHSTGKVLMISFTPLALVFPLLVFQLLTPHISLNLLHTFLEKNSCSLRLPCTLHFSLVACLLKKKEKNINLDYTLKLNSNALKSSIHF